MQSSNKGVVEVLGRSVPVLICERDSEQFSISSVGIENSKSFVGVWVKFAINRQDESRLVSCTRLNDGLFLLHLYSLVCSAASVTFPDFF